VAAVVVALALAGSSGLQKWLSDRRRARLVASRLIEPVKVLEDELRSEMVTFAFYNDDNHGSDDSYALRVLRLGSLASSINVEALQDLSSLPNDCAGRLAVALGIIEVLARDIETVTSTRQWSELIEIQRTFHVNRWRDQASKGADYLAVVRRELQAAADRIAKLPTPEEIYEGDN